MIAAQLSLPLPGPQRDPDEWVTGPVVDRGGLAIYAHLVWGPDDPPRSDRPKGGRADNAPHRTLRKSKDDHGARLLAHLGDGVPRTFNRIAVEFYDLESSVLFEGPVDRALWALVAAGQLEHTLAIPVLFRIPKASP
jgi:hypothetical protein